MHTTDDLTALDTLPAELMLPRTAVMPRGTAEAATRAALRVAGISVKHRYHDDPVGWAEHKGIFLWSKQREILRSLVKRRYTAVPACHGVGKSFIAAVAVCWWLDVHEVGEAFVVTTAPTDSQVKAILWREISRLHSKHALRGRITLDAQWYMSDGGTETLVAYGRKPAAYKNAEQASTAFQGIHADFVLVVVDESAGVPEWLFNAADSLATNEESRVIGFGNPDDPASHFEKICRPGSGWHRIQIGAKHTPNFTNEDVPARLRRLLISKTWVRERVKRWGKRSPLFIAKVLGRFPEVSSTTLISPRLVREAWMRDLSGNAIDAPGKYGVDVARDGNDETVIYINRGGHIRLRFATRDKIRTTATTGQIMATLREDTVDIDDLPVIVDEVGVGGGVVDQGIEQGLRIIAFSGGRRAWHPDKFANRNAETWWMFKVLMEEGLVDLDPDDEDLASQLQSRRWHRDSAGRIHVESKEKMAERGLPSPDRADAAVMSAVYPGTDEPDRDPAVVLDWQHIEREVQAREKVDIDPPKTYDESDLTSDLMEREF